VAAVHRYERQLVRKKVNEPKRDTGTYPFAEPQTFGALFLLSHRLPPANSPRPPFADCLHPIRCHWVEFSRGILAPIFNYPFADIVPPAASLCRQCAAQLTGIPQGTYSGTLQAGEAQLHLLLHLSKGADGSLRATLDSLEQGVFAIEANSASYANSSLKLELTSVGARFEGKVTPDHGIIHGSWSQGSASIPLIFRRETGAVARKPGDAIFPVEGLWQGAVETHGMRLRFQLHISHDTEGSLIAALDSLDQGSPGCPPTMSP